jgi:hypothetical protein
MQLTPKQKAKELVQNYLYKVIEFAYAETDYKELAKQCALIAVDEILNICPLANRDYWLEVRNELLKN